MDEEKLSEAPPFHSKRGTTFHCWIIGTGGAAHYEWRSKDKRVCAGRNLGKPTYWVSLDEELVRDEIRGEPIPYQTLSQALDEAARWAEMLDRQGFESKKPPAG